MQRWKEDFLSFWNNKIYVAMLCLTAVLGYGFMITHQTVGIDDTPYTYYFEDGLNVIIGRWFLFVLNKIFHVADFSPFITDLAGVLILMVAVTVWCTVLYSVCRDRVPMWGYVFFSCIFLSCPLISEVYTYYLHNGVSCGYLFVGVSLAFFKELVEWRRPVLCGLGSAFFLFAAMGCYESFMIVWLVGVLAVLLLMRCMGNRCKVFRVLLLGALLAIVAIIFRTIMIPLCTAVFDLGALKDGAIQRSIGEMLGWMVEPDAYAEFSMIIKRVLVMYFVFAHAYYPIRVFVLASAVIVIFALWRAIRQKDLWIGVLTVGLYIASFLLVVIEGSETLYRSAQFLPFICGFGALMLGFAVGNRPACKGLPGRCVTGVAVFVLSVVLWNQCFDMNRWFYVDWLKYQDAVRVAEQIATELEKNYDTSKPVVFAGTYAVPEGIIEDAYVPYGSETYFKMRRMTDKIDENLLDKFNRDYGVWVAQTPALSVIDWAIAAFDSTGEMVKFFAMHGYDLTLCTDMELRDEMNERMADYPHFPEEGSIVDMGDYIVVHF